MWRPFSANTDMQLISLAYHVIVIFFYHQLTALGKYIYTNTLHSQPTMFWFTMFFYQKSEEKDSLAKKPQKTCTWFHINFKYSLAQTFKPAGARSDTLVQGLILSNSGCWRNT